MDSEKYDTRATIYVSGAQTCCRSEDCSHNID